MNSSEYSPGTLESVASHRQMDLARKIIHIDMDAFYASIEQRDDPRLRGKPVAVGHSTERGVVLAASYEARGFGIRSAMSASAAISRCRDLVFVAPRFEHYRAISRIIQQILSQYTALIEPLALDEAYLDVTENLRGLPSASQTAFEIRRNILETTQLTASAGISYNKFLAKVASRQRKPNGQFVIRPEVGLAFIAALPISDFHGIGPVTARKMHRLGIFTGADLRCQSLELLQTHFGKSGRWYHAVAHGEDRRPVVPNRLRKSLGSEATFARDLLDPVEIAAALAGMVDEVWTSCRKARAFGRTITVKFKYCDFRQTTRSRTFRLPVASRDCLYATSIALAQTLCPPPKSVRLIGVSVSGFDRGPNRHDQHQLDLDLPR